MMTAERKPKAGDTVALSHLPSGFLDDLPIEDQAAIREVSGKPVLLRGYDDEEKAELEFTDRDGVLHFIYVHKNYIRATE